MERGNSKGVSEKENTGLQIGTPEMQKFRMYIFTVAY